jgi:hypothetical protein
MKPRNGANRHPTKHAFVRFVSWLILIYSVPPISLAASPAADLWVLHPVVRPDLPADASASKNPIDAFVAAEYAAHGLKPVGPTDKRTLLRRVYFDLVGLPPTPQEQDAFLADTSPDAYEKVVDRLLASEQHGVRYGRHWLDVLRYADADEQMIAARGIHLWREWVIRALNDDVPYDQFVRAQLTGNRSNVHTQVSSLGYRTRVEPRPDDLFALGFLARGHVLRDGKDVQELSITAVDTVSTAFMGLTVGCAKCHDHMYDPIKKSEFYSMKALFDPLVLRKMVLATPAEIMAAGKVRGDAESRRAAIQKPIDELVEPYKKKLYDDRVAMLPDDVRAIVLKPEKQRTAAEQKIADDYFPVLRIDADKFLPTLSEADRKKYDQLQKQLNESGGRGRDRGSLPTFWTVEDDPIRLQAKSYQLNSAEPDRPELNHEVQPGWPFEPAGVDLRDGRREAFSDWLTAPQNPMFARVAVNRLWQWHFGEGLEKTPNDFGTLGGMPSNPKLLDWLAAEFVARGFSMKQMHRLMVTSDTYKLASEVGPSADADNIRRDPADTFFWHFRLQRLEAEPIWDSILSAAGNLDITLGGPSFDPVTDSGHSNRRAAYMVRGYSTNGDVTPNFLRSFDVDDGRAPCPVRTQTVTAPQALFAMNSPEIDRATAKFAERLKQESKGDLHAAIDLGYRMTLARPPSADEATRAEAYLQGDPARLKSFGWLLLNLDEFVYVR